MVRARTRVMNQLQAVALNQGLRSKKRLWRERDRQQLESFQLRPWASRRRHDLLHLLDELNPTILELTQAVEREAEKCPEARRLRTHPGGGRFDGAGVCSHSHMLKESHGSFFMHFWDWTASVGGWNHTRKVQACGGAR